MGRRRKPIPFGTKEKSEIFCQFFGFEPKDGTVKSLMKAVRSVDPSKYNSIETDIRASETATYEEWSEQEFGSVEDKFCGDVFEYHQLLRHAIALAQGKCVSLAEW